MVDKLDEFEEEYFSILKSPLERMRLNGADLLFANDVIF